MHPLEHLCVPHFENHWAEVTHHAENIRLLGQLHYQKIHQSRHASKANQRSFKTRYGRFVPMWSLYYSSSPKSVKASGNAHSDKHAIYLAAKDEVSCAGWRKPTFFHLGFMCRLVICWWYNILIKAKCAGGALRKVRVVQAILTRFLDQKFWWSLSNLWKHWACAKEFAFGVNPRQQ